MGLACPPVPGRIPARRSGPLGRDAMARYFIRVLRLEPLLGVQMGSADSIDPLNYYNLEDFLFGAVRERFERDHSLSAFDFFSIIIWKANRAKSKVAVNLMKCDRQRRGDLEAIVRALTSEVWDQPDEQSRLKILLEIWGMRLPMASAILSVLWPEQFTVYDVRVCGELLNKGCDDFKRLAELKSFEGLWKGYCRYVNAVRTAVNREVSLRDKDRFLWGQSAKRQLESDIQNCFQRAKGGG